MHALLELNKEQKHSSRPAFVLCLHLEGPKLAMAMHDPLTLLFAIASEYDSHKDLHLYIDVQAQWAFVRTLSSTKIKLELILHQLTCILMGNFFIRLFKESPHPDEKQRQQLSKQLGLAPRQVKFWFQNRRTQLKVRAIDIFSVDS